MTPLRLARRLCMSFILVAAFGALVARADTTITGTINFTVTGCASPPCSVVPTGSFTYDSSTSTFTYFTVTYDGATYDFINSGEPDNANNPQLSGSDPCLQGATGGAATFALLTSCSGAWQELSTTQNSGFAIFDAVSAIGALSSIGSLVPSEEHGRYTVSISSQCQATSIKTINISPTCPVVAGFLQFASWGPKLLEQFDDGTKLELECRGGSSVVFPEWDYMLWYTNLQGDRRRIAQCLFDAGQNKASYMRGQTSNGKSCLVSTQWMNVQAGDSNDPLNSDPIGVGKQFFTAAETLPLMDVVKYNYDALTNKLSWTDDKYVYPDYTAVRNIFGNILYYSVDGPQILLILDSERPVPGVGVVVDPFVGPETEQLFDSVLQRLPTQPKQPMQFIAGCDLNADGVCDAADESLLSGAVGTCQGQRGYVALADVDGDGCVTTTDVEAVQAAFAEYRAGCTRSLGYWKNATSWPVNNLTVGNQSYSESELLQILRQPVHGNGAVDLAHQMIAAKLNIAAGASPVAAPVVSADAIFLNLVPGRLPPLGNASLPSASVSNYVDMLDRYNEGLIGPGPCTN